MSNAIRKHAIIVTLVLGAMMTPPDPFSQILIAIPLILLYQISIYIAKRVESEDETEALTTTNDTKKS